MADDPIIYTFFGKIFPERANVNFFPITTNFNIKDFGIEGTLKTYISVSQITAQFSTTKRVENVQTLKNHVEDIVRLEVDILGYTLSCGYDVEITSMIDSLGHGDLIFGVNFEHDIEEFRKKHPSPNEILSLLSNKMDDYLRLCLSDLREAIRKPKDTGFFCYRGIESLSHHFSQKYRISDDKIKWEKMRHELEINESDLRYIKEFADPVRHGKVTLITDTDRRKILDKTWEIVDKYIIYGRNGYQKIQNK